MLKVKRKTGRDGANQHVDEDCLDLRLYVKNKTPTCLSAFANISRICEDCFTGRYRITVIDLEKNPEVVRKEGIIAVPTLVRVTGDYQGRKVVGTLTDARRVLSALGLTCGSRLPTMYGRG